MGGRKIGSRIDVQIFCCGVFNQFIVDDGKTSSGTDVETSFGGKFYPWPGLDLLLLQDWDLQLGRFKAFNFQLLNYDIGHDYNCSFIRDDS